MLPDLSHFLVRLLIAAFFFSVSPFRAAAAHGGATHPENHVPREVGTVTRTLSGSVELCIDCHKERPDKAHGREVLGCSVCHRGNPLAGRPEDAHRGMILNPGELRFAEMTCGQAGCHQKEVTWVKNSLMATNRGIMSTLRYYWGETGDHHEDISVETLIKTGFSSPSVDYFRKLCGTCHLWMEKRSLPDFLASKGGGCTACHFVPMDDVPKGERHPQVTRKIPLENCVRCHNRSGRIGLSYQGRYETEGYNTPLEGGGLSSRVLEDGRHYKKLPDDVHHRAGLLCIDCHTQREVMGDGSRHAHFEEQLEVTCHTCHGDREMLKDILRENEEFKNAGPNVDRKRVFPGLSVEMREGVFVLVGKQDGKPHPLDPPDPLACGHRTHKRLSCQACHATWVPQCYGCHVRMDAGGSQLDKIAVRETPGRWQEFKGFMRHEVPPLGVRKDPSTGAEEIVDLVPG